MEKLIGMVAISLIAFTGSVYANGTVGSQSVKMESMVEHTPNGIYEIEAYDGIVRPLDVNTGETINTQFRLGKDFEDGNIIEVVNNKIVSIWNMSPQYNNGEKIYFVADVVEAEGIEYYAIQNVHDSYDIELLKASVDLEFRDIVQLDGTFITSETCLNFNFENGEYEY